MVIVIINSGSSSINETFAVENWSVSSIIPYVTSANEICQQGKSISVSGGTFKATLDASSVNTLVSN